MLNRYDKSLEPSTLIQLSGGIDSAYVLWHWLKNNPNDICLVHHINLINHEGRNSVESKAVKDILNYLEQSGMGNYIYLENTFDYGNLSFIIKDVEVCGFHLGLIIRNPRWHIKEILLPIYGHETKREAVRRKLVDLVSYQKKVLLTYPLMGRNKGDVMAEMPKELLNLCWYCRTPKNSQPCGTCKTCKEVEKYKK